MKRRWCCLVLLLVLLLISGCTVTTGGNARPAPNLKPRPLSGQTIKQVLLDGDALGKLLNQTFYRESNFPPKFGGRDQLAEASGTPSRPDCVGVDTLLEKRAYQSADIKDVARESWWHEASAGPALVISLTEGIVTLPTSADANALFTKFVAQWQQCNGATVDMPDGNYGFTTAISDVRLANSVVAATTSVSPMYRVSKPIPHARALGVRVNCIVETDIAFYSSGDPGDRGSADLNTSGIDIAHIMMDKVSSLT